jgi:hypothetical protein
MPNCLHRLLAALGATAAIVGAADAPMPVLEPAQASEVTPRKPERARWSWNREQAQVVATGDLTWKPDAFTFEAGKTVRYIDFDHGSDDNDGASKEKPWKHHPWDAAATGRAKEGKGPITYVFKRGVAYRGELHAGESGAEGDPIRLTSDPAWGKGEAEILGSEAITGWKQGADRADIPDAGKVWYVDVDFKPRCMWVRDGERIERVELARIPNWKVSDPADVKSEWWRLEQPAWWENNCGKYKVDFNGHRAWLGVDAAHLTGPADNYVGAIAHVEFGWVMGTPFPTRVEGFDASKKGFFFQGIWWGDSENIVAGMHYYLEDKPNFLSDAGEFWFDEGKKRLYARLPGDKDPNAADVEVAKHINLIDSTGLSHVVISGLSFRFTNVTWDFVQPGWADPNINNACFRVRGRAEDLRIANCKFDHCGKAVRIDCNGYDYEHSTNANLDHIVISDNDIDQTDHGAIEVNSHAVGDVKVLRNHLHLIGLRNNRQDHCFAMYVHCCETTEIAGNIIERTTGSGIMSEAQCGDGMPRLSRNLVHHNKASETLLSANDWGGIETNGYPFMNYDNISADPSGLWNGFDPSKPGSASLGMAYYWDHGHAVNGFNLIAYGATDDWKSKRIAHAGLYEASTTIENKLFNSTFYRFYTGSQWSPGGGRHLMLGDIFDDIGGRVIQHGPLKEDKGKPQTYPHRTMAYARNVFSNVPKTTERAKDGGIERAFAVYELNGASYDDPQAMAASFAAHPALASDVGTLAEQSPLRDPANHDFRPKPGSAAIDHGVRMFVPWALATTVGEWHFRRDQSDPTIVQDDHFCNAPYTNGETQYQAPLFNLVGHGIAAKDYVAGALEDWVDGALTFNGKDQYAGLAQSEIGKPYKWQAGTNQKVAQGKDIVSPDIDASSLLIEVYLQSKQAGGVIVAKRSDSGYQLALNHKGGVTLTLLAGGKRAELASGARIADGKWHHVLAEFDHAGKRGAIYTDGVKSADGALDLGDGASLSNDGDLLLGKGPDGGYFAGALDYLRIARTTLGESKTSIEELYDWEFDGPFLRDFAGKSPTGKCRDAGALEAE